MKKITFVSGCVGALVSIYSIVRWSFVYEDLSQMCFGLGLGVTILAFSYIYEWMKLKDEEIKNLSYRVDSIVYPPSKE